MISHESLPNRLPLLETRALTFSIDQALLLRAITLTVCEGELVGLIVPSPALFGSFSLWFGGISAMTWMNRDRQMALFGMLVMSGKQLLWLFVGLSVLMFLFSNTSISLKFGHTNNENKDHFSSVFPFGWICSA